MKHTIVKVKSVNKITHDVLKIVTEKPDNFHFNSGQATEVSINKRDWKEKKRPFTFTCLPSDAYLEFTIKTYPEHQSVTNELLLLEKEDELILHDVFGTIKYKGEGVFIAGGAGVTPFISIFRNLNQKNELGDNKLFFANKTKADIILEAEFKDLLGANFIPILSDEDLEEYAYGMISSDFIISNSDGLDKLFYICGPPSMMEAIEKQLTDLGVITDSIIKEVF